MGVGIPEVINTKRQRAERSRGLTVIYAVMVSIIILILLAGHLAQMAGWAMVFIAIGEFSEFAAALEHSAVNYATLGYGDIVMSPHWRILGPLEAVSGTLAFGWTTAVLVNVVGRLVHAGHR